MLWYPQVGDCNGGQFLSTLGNKCCTTHILRLVIAVVCLRTSYEAVGTGVFSVQLQGRTREEVVSRFGLAVKR